MKKLQSEKGFTLVELMIVVAIIGILAAIAIPQFNAYRMRGFNASAQSDVKNAVTAEASLSSVYQQYGQTTGPAAGALCASVVAVLVTGGTPNVDPHICTTDNAGAIFGDKIPVGNGVSLIANTDVVPAGAAAVARAANFIAGAKHAQGNRCYAVDGGNTNLYFDETTANCNTPGQTLVVATIPPPAAPANPPTASPLEAAPWVIQ